MSKNKKPVKEDRPTRAETHTGSTVQGGSDFGQGSGELGKKANRQGETKNEGSNYENETGWDNEALRSEDIEENNG